jgi:hypothetical protein
LVYRNFFGKSDVGGEKKEKKKYSSMSMSEENLKK